MVDRVARDRLASILHSYMDDEITAFQFDELLDEFRPFPSDRTVECIAMDLWGCYDDLKDHKVVASKQQWDYFNRILLLLSSDTEIELVRNGLRWHSSQIVAAICLVLAVVLSLWIGQKNLPKVTVPFGFVSIGIWLFQRKRDSKSSLEQSLAPFPSFGALSFVRRGMVGFSKKALPKVVAHRRIRNPIMTWLCAAPFGILWVVFSPVALFLQALPLRAWQTRLNQPGIGNDKV